MKVLVANRGEIAVRILRACRDLGLPSVAVYSEGDRDALHTRHADEALVIGPTPAVESYLKIPALLDAARRCRADAVHPGYGFLSEHAGFAEAVEAAGMAFIGPRPETLAVTGDKVAARRIAREAGLPVLRGPDRPLSQTSPARAMDGLSYPVLVKAVSGGGGRGIRLVRSAAELMPMVTAARREAAASFGDDGVYLEPLIEHARHIEVQILGDGTGRVLCLGERECSIQRRRQKLIEEAPAPGLSDAQRTYLFEAAARLGSALRYRSLGTVEFLLDIKGDFHFIEINPRIQVEHPVTEMVTGMDLVQEQLRLAAGRLLRYRQEEIPSRGAAIEARVLAEEPIRSGSGPHATLDFLPTTGEITYLKEPGGPGIRVDSALYQGMQITVDYDSLLAKVIGWGPSRAVALVRLRRALHEFQIGGVATDLAFLQQILASVPFISGRVHTTYLDSFKLRDGGDARALAPEIAAAAALLAHQAEAEVRRRVLARVESAEGRERGGTQRATGGLWRAAAWREQM